MSKKNTEAKPGAEPEETVVSTVPDAPTSLVQPSIVQPMIDELTAQSPPEVPTDDKTPPPRGPLHPPQPAERHHEDPGDPVGI